MLHEIFGQKKSVHATAVFESSTSSSTVIIQTLDRMQEPNEDSVESEVIEEYLVDDGSDINELRPVTQSNANVSRSTVASKPIRLGKSQQKRLIPPKHRKIVTPGTSSQFSNLESESGFDAYGSDNPYNTQYLPETGSQLIDLPSSQDGEASNTRSTISTVSDRNSSHHTSIVPPRFRSYVHGDLRTDAPRPSSTGLSSNDNSSRSNSPVISVAADDDGIVIEADSRRSIYQPRKRRAGGSLPAIMELQEKRLKIEEDKASNEIEIKKLELEQQFKVKQLEIESQERIAMAKIQMENDMMERVKKYELNLNAEHRE